VVGARECRAQRTSPLLAIALDPPPSANIAAAVRVEPNSEIAIPDFPPGTEWVGGRELRLHRVLGRAIVLVEFFDIARVNSRRTLPYLRVWRDRYSDHHLQLIGIHAPAYSFGRDAALVARACARLGIDWPVAHDPDFEIWRLYGNRGWPARYLFDQRGQLRHLHFGEGEYQETELAIQELVRETDPGAELPPPLAPLRPEDAPGAVLEPQTADIELPGDRARLELEGEWRAGDDYLEAASAGAVAHFRFRAGGAFAVLSGDREPDLYETDGEIVAERPGLRLHAIQFTPLPPRERSAG